MRSKRQVGFLNKKTYQTQHFLKRVLCIAWYVYFFLDIKIKYLSDCTKMKSSGSTAIYRFL